MKIYFFYLYFFLHILSVYCNIYIYDNINNRAKDHYLVKNDNSVNKNYMLEVKGMRNMTSINNTSKPVYRLSRYTSHSLADISYRYKNK